MHNRQGRYNGEWITFDKEQLRATKQPIEGPVDGTIFTIETKAPHLEGKLEFFIDEDGELDLWHVASFLVRPH